ncbi:hypothetical protein MMC13_001317 [Lambiella insularis]|nr:hypothetical protein [Lambiella insularis]
MPAIRNLQQFLDILNPITCFLAQLALRDAAWETHFVSNGDLGTITSLRTSLNPVSNSIHKQISTMGSTIIDLKKSFLQTQVRTLNLPLSPSHGWRDNSPASSQDDLEEEVVQEVVHKLNTIIRKQNRIIYSAQALRHVAEQIDALYWAAGAPDVHTGELEDGDIARDSDLRDHETILTLPEEWAQEDTEDASGLEQFAESSRYKQLRSRLVALSEKRAAQQAKLAQMRQLRQLLQPFRRPLENIQPNLVTKDGELARELERMKVLMARVRGKIESLNAVIGTHELEEVEDTNTNHKFQTVLDRRPVELTAD